MTIKRIIFALVALFIFSISPKAAHAQNYSYSLSSFDSNITINKDSSVNVEEMIVANFAVPKHGIYRTIPIKYKDSSGQNLDIRFSLKSVTDGSNNALRYSTSKSGNDITIKIGDPNQTVTGTNTYKIKYSVNRVITRFSDHDELYWNVNGNGWDTIIDRISTTVSFTFDSPFENIQKTGFVGTFGSQNENINIAQTGKSIQYTTKNRLSEGEGMTIVFGFPKDYVKAPGIFQKTVWAMQDNIFYFLPLLVAAIMLYLLFKKGRDPKGRQTIAPEFEIPDDLSPSEVATILKERITNNDISAEIIALATKGYLKILEPKKNKFYLEKTSESKKLNALQKSLLGAIFQDADKVEISKIDNLYQIISAQKSALYLKITKNGYFPQNPNLVRITYFGLAGGVAVLGFFIFTLDSNPSVIVGFIFSAIIIAIVGNFMPRKTDKGAETARKIKGLKLYLKTAERYRLKFEEDERIFEKFLPFAMVLGVVEYWAKAFKGIYNKAPDWYDGYYSNNFVPLYFATHLSNSTANALSAKMSPPASRGGSGFGGGGFSGGGFGGGGGGSW